MFRFSRLRPLPWLGTLQLRADMFTAGSASVSSADTISLGIPLAFVLSVGRPGCPEPGNSKYIALGAALSGAREYVLINVPGIREARTRSDQTPASLRPVSSRQY